MVQREDSHAATGGHRRGLPSHGSSQEFYWLGTPHRCGRSIRDRFSTPTSRRRQRSHDVNDGIGLRPGEKNKEITMSESCVVFNDGDLAFTVKCTSLGKTGKEVLKNLLLDADAEGADCFFREDEGATREKF